MRKNFQFWLFGFIGTACLLSFAASFYYQSILAAQHAEKILSMKIQEIRSRIRADEKQFHMVREIVAETALVKCRILGRLFQNNPRFTKNADALRNLLIPMNLSFIQLTGADGIVSVSTDKTDGTDLKKLRNAVDFLDALRNPAFESIQIPARDLPREQRMFHAFAARRDLPGIIHIGFFSPKYNEIIEETDIREIAKSVQIGSGGRILIAHERTIVGSSDEKDIGRLFDSFGMGLYNCTGGESFQLRLSEKSWFCLAQSADDWTLLAMLPVDDLYFRRNQSAVFLTSTNLLLFAGLFFFLMILIDRMIIREFRKINKSLQIITEGNLDERVSVRGCAEFNALSDGLNTMVSAIKNIRAKNAARIAAQLKAARDIPKSTLPELSEAYTGQSGFSINVHSSNNEVFNGDFYDFFLISKHMLVFLIGRASAVGTPGAVSMMKIKMLLKGLIESACTPDEVLSFAEESMAAGASFLENPACSVYLGYLNLKTGLLRSISAGHSAPLLRPPGKNAYEPSVIELGPRLGEGFRFRKAMVKTMVEPGSRLVLYTVDDKDEERFRELLTNLSTSPVNDDSVLADALAKSFRAETGADISVMTVDYTRPPSVEP